ncbi:cobalamin biosynthesis protein [Stenomitos frigidus]|uniref:cobalamin biosynthesis protein n=1 Tax=Stenomitos frigidus TaxID=1886765 RepID=UPI0015E77957|nr:cobalamin biosynthesis protein [Stenomitos frigidus]
MKHSKTETLGSQCPLRNLWVGIGCKRGTPKVVIEQAVRTVFQTYALSEDSIAGIATLDTKADEEGLITFCRDRQLPLRYFSADVLRSVAIPSPSSAIEASVSTPSVAEAAALLACVPHSTSQLCIPKQIVREMEQPGLVTIAVARSVTENVASLHEIP